MRIDNNRPISAFDLGNLLKAMANDYRSITGGRTLAVGSVEGGSLLLVFQDAVTYAMAHADGVKPYAEIAAELVSASAAILKFLDKIKETFFKKEDQAKSLSIETLKLLTKLARESESNIEFTSQHGFMITPQSAGEYADRNKTEPLNEKELGADADTEAQSAKPKDHSMDIEAQLAAFEDRLVERLETRLVEKLMDRVDKSMRKRPASRA
jgi:hypothetical protein